MSSRVDVAVNLLWLAPGRVGGSEQYLTRQLAGLPDDAGIAPRLLCQRTFVGAYHALAERYAAEVLPLDRDWRGVRIVADHTWLAARSRCADVVHHGGGTVPLGGPGPILLTIHDLQYLEHPEYFSSARLAYLRRMMPRSARRAAVIATPSGFVRDTVVAAFGVAAERVVVVPHGVPTTSQPSDAAMGMVRRRFRLGTRPYLVYPAITHPHKGHRTLIEMLAQLDDDLVLVLIGGSGAAETGVTAAIAESGLAGRIVRTGRVGDGDRDALIAGADALVFPSRYEGFGAPLVEAMMLDTPIVCSAHAAVREVVGDAAVVVAEHPGAVDGEAWADAVRTALGRREELLAAGRLRRAEFTLAASGAALAKAYHQAAPRMKVVVLCPHFEPDTAPTGAVMTRIVRELASRGHELHVVTALPWYREHRIEPEWGGRWARTERTEWGSVIRVHPFPGDDKANLVRRAAGFAAFSVLAGLAGLRAGGFQRVDVVLAMSPPLTLGLTGWLVGVYRRAPLVFNVQDIFPDAAIRTGAIRSRRVIALAERLERATYRRAGAVTVLSDGLRRNVTAKIGVDLRDRVHVIPNFVDTDAITPGSRATAYRHELGICEEPVVLYAGNVGFSQSLELVVEAARALPGVTFVINGDGAARLDLERRAAGLENVRFSGYQPVSRLSDVLATGDIHVVPLRAGLGDVSVPSKTYSSLAAGRPVVASIDLDSEIPRLLDVSGAGTAVAPDDPAALIAAVRELIDDPARASAMGTRGREWAVREASPEAVGAAYDRLLRSIAPRSGAP